MCRVVCMFWLANMPSYLYGGGRVTSRAIVRDPLLILDLVRFTLLRKVKENIGNVDRIL